MYFLLTTRCSAQHDAQGDIPQGETSTSASSSPPTHASLPQLHLPCHQASPISTVVSTIEGQILGQGLPPPTPQRPTNPHHSCVTSRYITIPIVSSLSFLALGAPRHTTTELHTPLFSRPSSPVPRCDRSHITSDLQRDNASCRGFILGGCPVGGYSAARTIVIRSSTYCNTTCSNMHNDGITHGGS